MEDLVAAGAPAPLPGPPELRPERPDAIVDLQSTDGVQLVRGQWRFHEAHVAEVEFVGVGHPDDPLGPGLVPNRTYDVLPHAEAREFDDGRWRTLAPADTELRLSTGRVCFCWYRIRVTVPERVGALETEGCAVVFEIVIDDYAEVWVDGRLPRALGDVGGPVVSGFNAPNRVLLTEDARPGATFQLAVLGINGPISASPPNYIWVRNASLDFYASGRQRTSRLVRGRRANAGRGLDAAIDADAELEQVAAGFGSVDGPVWGPDEALLFSSPGANCIYRWDPAGRVTVFRPKSGYRGFDVGRFSRPGSSGLAIDDAGRLTICQHGDRRIVRVEPHGDVSVVADRFEGHRLNSPHDLVYRSDGALFFTDPPFGLPGGFGDPGRELSVSGVFCRLDGDLRILTSELRGPSGLAFAPGERVLYVGDRGPGRNAVMRFELDDDRIVGSRVFLELPDPGGLRGVGGLAVDRAGTLFACAPEGVHVVSEDGLHLGTLGLPEAPSNLAWGDADRRTLYITAETAVYRIRPRLGVAPRD